MGVGQHGVVTAWGGTAWGGVACYGAVMGWQQHGCQQACATYTGDVYRQTNVQTNLIIPVYLIQYYTVLGCKHK